MKSKQPEKSDRASYRSVAFDMQDRKGITRPAVPVLQTKVAAKPVQRKGGNNTGLPDNLKEGVESLSGIAMDDVKVHYNSDKPQNLQALAYAQGTDIHIAPGQEKHLPHEAWHVVQQKQGRVQPTIQMKAGIAVNDDKGLETEADLMGTKALNTLSKDEPGLQEGNKAGNTIQMWTQQGYNVDNSDRTLHVDTRNVTWGGTGGPGNHANHVQAGNERAIIFETISREANLNNILQRLNQPATLWDTGLTVVINRAYTPPRIFNAQGNPTNVNSTEGVSSQTARNSLDQTWNQMNAAWNGMPIQVVTAAWERREVNRDGNSSLENVQGTVPYSTFRRIAATNPGVDAIEHALRENHEHVWRKMGDDDMPYVDPNLNVGEMQKLTEVEEEGLMYASNTFVTFGYNLETAGTLPPITQILQGLYRKEMQLRDKIAELGVPMYPSEPTTFYRPREEGSMNVPWGIMESQHVGGSGQQLEGAKLAKAMKAGEGYKHYTYHTIMVNTGAGARNDALVALLNGWYNNGNGDPLTFRPDLVEAEINKLDQSALRHDEYLKKVIGNLGGGLQQSIHKKIEELVATYRKEASAEACATLKAAIPLHVQQAQANNRFLASWRQSQQERWNKLANF